MGLELFSYSVREFVFPQRVFDGKKPTKCLNTNILNTKYEYSNNYLHYVSCIKTRAQYFNQ